MKKFSLIDWLVLIFLIYTVYIIVLCIGSLYFYITPQTFVIDTTAGSLRYNEDQEVLQGAGIVTITDARIQRKSFPAHWFLALIIVGLLSILFFIAIGIWKLVQVFYPHKEEPHLHEYSTSKITNHSSLNSKAFFHHR